MSTTAQGMVIGGREDLWRCVVCGGGIDGSHAGDALACASCGHEYPIRDGVIVAREATSDNNEVARNFYDGPLWPKFRFWEKFTWVNLGGERRARNQVLKHLPDAARINLLDVAIGDGSYLDWIPQGWPIVGVDISTVQLADCRRKHPGRDLILVRAEAEELPFRDGSFDAALSIGAFNYFNDPELSLREMLRVVKPGGTVIVSDEIPNLTDRLPFRKIGLPKIDHWIVSRLMNLGDEFTEMVERLRKLDVEAIARRVMPDCRYESIWRGVGYVIVGKVPE